MAEPATSSNPANWALMLTTFPPPNYRVEFITHDSWNCFWKVWEGNYSCILTTDPSTTDLTILKSILDAQQIIPL